MSTRIMSMCWPLRMRPAPKAVLVSLADMANDDGYCWPTIDRICERTCYGRTAVIEAIAWLEGCGALRASRSNGRKTTYWVQPGRFVAEATNPAEAVDNLGNQYATRTRPPGEPVREADQTRPPGGLDPSARRTLIPKNRQETEIPPQPPADAGGERASVQKHMKPVNAEAGRELGFERFWSVFPRKTEEKAARRQWRRLGPGPDLVEQIVAAAAAWAASARWREEGGRYVPKASTWLHGERWRDVLPAAVAGAGECWWETMDGIRGRGAELGVAYDPRALGSAWTDDELRQHNCAYRERVFAAAGDGPWRRHGKA